MSAPAPLPLARLFAGTLVGLLLAWLALEAVSLAPRRYGPGEDVWLGEAPAAVAGVRVSVVETGRSRVWAPRLAQGLAPGFRDVVVRVAVIEHPDGIVLFGAGVAPGASAPGALSPVTNPFASLGDVRGVSDVVPVDQVVAVVLPSLRWYDVGDVPRFPNARLIATGSEAWAAVDGPWPRRFAIDRERVLPWVARIESPPMRPGGLLGQNEHADLFGDGSVLLAGFRGAGFDELIAVVTDEQGERWVLVTDAVWVHEGVDALAPRSPWSIWLHDRSWRSVIRTQRTLHQAAAEGWHVVPLLDAEVPLPLYGSRRAAGQAR